ncbi:hypothetical protein ES703_113910 [subsurface metagenome]
MDFNAHGQPRNDFIEGLVDPFTDFDSIDTGYIGGGNSDGRLPVVPHQSLWRFGIPLLHRSEIPDSNQFIRASRFNRTARIRHQVGHLISKGGTDVQIAYIFGRFKFACWGNSKTLLIKIHTASVHHHVLLLKGCANAGIG